ncbi:uncharacterized protein LOC135640785 [Musa acuminata AAA Group]|uniref:uncharacterized protein LOC135640785 n=1 Tax=Musa acuminata AAA Group TaxID=214697 RepID=UPI0031D50069
MDPSWELMSLLEELNGSVMEIPAVNENYLFHQAELCVPFADHLSGSLSAICQTPIPQPQAVACRAGQSHGAKERKDIEAPDASNEHSPVAPPETRLTEVKMKSNKNAMGTARMLDEIINYVQSLQNQVEFLSMKLSAASSFYGYCFDMETIATPQVMSACMKL